MGLLAFIIAFIAVYINAFDYVLLTAP